MYIITDGETGNILSCTGKFEPKEKAVAMEFTSYKIAHDYLLYMFKHLWHDERAFEAEMASLYIEEKEKESV